MSEPSSLYVRVQLSEGALAAFQASTPALPNAYADWLPWLATQQFHGQITDRDIQAMGPGVATRSVGETLALWLNQPYANAGEAQYDNATQTWTLGLLECSENYKDFILVLSVLRAIAGYKDLPGEDFILIYPYLWGGAPEAYVEVTSGKSRLVAETPSALLAEAETGLARIYAALASKFGGEEP